MRFSEHLKEALSFEEGMVHRINGVLALFLEKSDLPQEVAESVKSVLKILSDESLEHKSIVEGILKELEGDDRKGCNS